MNLSLAVVQGVVSFNGVPVAEGAISTLHIAANLYEKLRSTGKIVAASQTFVVIQVSVAESLTTTGSVVSVQELIRYFEFFPTITASGKLLAALWQPLLWTQLSFQSIKMATNCLVL